MVQEQLKRKLKGFTLTELLMTVIILAVLLTIAIPAYNSFIKQKILKSATEDLYNFIKVAQTQSLTDHKNVYISFNPQVNWCYGLSDSSPCDCTVANNCTMNTIETVVNSSNYSGATITLTINGFSGSPSSPYIQVDGIRGTIDSAGSISLSTSSLSITISANTAGLVTVCSNNVTGFESCP